MAWFWQFVRRARATPPHRPPALVRSSASAGAAAVLAQRLTGAGSGPYSGTPFVLAPVVVAVAAGGRGPAAGEAGEAARQDTPGPRHHRPLPPRLLPRPSLTMTASLDEETR